MKKIIATLVVTGALVLSACNTVRGAGQDVSSAGDAISNSTK